MYLQTNKLFFVNVVPFQSEKQSSKPTRIYDEFDRNKKPKTS